MACRYPSDEAGARPRAFMAYSASGAKDAIMRRFSLLVPLALALAAATPARAEGDVRPAPKRVCLTPAETREEIKTRHLHEPFEVLKHASQHYKAESLNAKLCRIDDEFIYEIALLHKDGKFFRAYVNATSGKFVEIKRASGPVPTAKN
jgi:hypothetical protein